jgi:tetratricopeptide (TPR) repeat protein
VLHINGKSSALTSAVLLGLWFTAASGCKLAAQGKNTEGVRLYQQGYYQGAVQRFQEAIKNDPNNGDSYYNLAALYHHTWKQNQERQDFEQAESYYNQCLDRSPDHIDCYRGLAVLLVEDGRKEEALRLLDGWAVRSPSSAAPRIELARLHEEFGDREAAKANLLEAISLEANNPRALAALGRLREELGEHSQALVAYQRSLTYDRFQPEVAARVASLRTALSPTPLITNPPGTTTIVTRPGANVR